MVTVFAPAAALIFTGSADFLGGMATRHAHVLSVLLVSSTSGMAVTVGAALLAGGSPQAAGIAWGACAGAAGGVGFMFFYAGLAAGPMSVVAPLSALVSTVLPIAVALAEGERPGSRVYAGALRCASPRSCWSVPVVRRQQSRSRLRQPTLNARLDGLLPA